MLRAREDSRTSRHQPTVPPNLTGLDRREVANRNELPARAGVSVRRVGQILVSQLQRHASGPVRFHFPLRTHPTLEFPLRDDAPVDAFVRAKSSPLTCPPRLVG